MSTLYIGNFEKDEFQFRKVLKDSDAKVVEFHYMSNVNDELNPCGSPTKQAKFEFYVMTDTGKRILIAMKFHRMTHDEKFDRLKKKYGAWAKKYGVSVSDKHVFTGTVKSWAGGSSISY